MKLVKFQEYGGISRGQCIELGNINFGYAYSGAICRHIPHLQIHSLNLHNKWN